jgi:hypothetical protein
MSPTTLTSVAINTNHHRRRHRRSDVVRVYRPDCSSNKTKPRMSYKYDRTRTGVFDVAFEPLYSFCRCLLRTDFVLTMSSQRCSQTPIQIISSRHGGLITPYWLSSDHTDEHACQKSVPIDRSTALCIVMIHVGPPTQRQSSTWNKVYRRRGYFSNSIRPGVLRRTRLHSRNVILL